MSCIKYMHVCTLHKLPLLSLSLLSADEYVV